MTRKTLTFLMVSSLIVSLSTGCSKSTVTNKATSTPKSDSTSDAPVTLTVASPPFGLDEYNNYFVPEIAAKFPNIKLEKVDIGGGYTYEKDILAKGIKPDLIISATPGLLPLKTTGLAYDLDPIIKKSNYDLNRFDPNMIQVVRDFVDGSGLIAIPYMRDVVALYYNKDIFDKFGIEYPKDGMTWTQARDLAKKVTRNVDGIQYRGLDTTPIGNVASALGIRAVDEKTQKATVDTEDWKYVFTFMKSLYDIPGNSHYDWGAVEMKELLKDQTLAMFAGLNFANAGLGQAEGLNWDLVSYPTFEQAPGKSMATGMRVLAIASTSEHKDVAFKVIQALTTDDMMMKLSGAGKGPVVKSEAVQKNFGLQVPYLKGKNVQAIFKTTPAKLIPGTEYDKQVGPVLKTAMDNVVSGKEDVNTALREANDKVNQIIRDQK